MSTLAVLLDLILSGLMLAGVLVLSAVLLTAWRAITGAHPIDPATLPSRDRHPSRALPRRWE